MRKYLARGRKAKAYKSHNSPFNLRTRRWVYFKHT